MNQTDTAKTVLIVEDDPAFRDHLSQIIRQAEGFELLKAAATCAEADVALDQKAPDILLTDLHLPDGSGIDLIRKAASRSPRTEILVITVFGDEEHVMASLEAGATGYLLKDSLPEELIGTIRQVLAGGSPITPVIARRILKKFRPPVPETPAESPVEMVLSSRETEVLGYIAKGFSFKEIADLLKISPHTVTAHVKKIYQKLGVHSRGEAVYEANQLGLL